MQRELQTVDPNGTGILGQFSDRYPRANSANPNLAIYSVLYYREFLCGKFFLFKF